jgi:methylmalonyl-CoA/ethylmalonyl-CoA epimerase
MKDNQIGFILENLNFFGDFATFDHLGYCVRSISNFYKELPTTIDNTQKVKVGFFKMNGLKVELVEPLSESSPITKMLEKGQSIYHVCFRIDDIEDAIAQARKNDFHCIVKPVPAKAFEGKRIAWLFNRDLGLVELLEA